MNDETMGLGKDLERRIGALIIPAKEVMAAVNGGDYGLALYALDAFTQHELLPQGAQDGLYAGLALQLAGELGEDSKLGSSAEQRAIMEQLVGYFSSNSKYLAKPAAE